MRSLPTVVMLPTPFEKTSRAGWVQRRFLHNCTTSQTNGPMGRLPGGRRRAFTTRESACAAHITEPVSRNSEEFGRMSVPHHPCDAPRRRPCLPLQKGAARRSRRVTKWGKLTPTFTAPGRHTEVTGSVIGLERLDIVRHLVTPAHVKVSPCGEIQQDRLNLPFPAVQGFAPLRGRFVSYPSRLKRSSLFSNIAACAFGDALTGLLPPEGCGGTGSVRLAAHHVEIAQPLP